MFVYAEDIMHDNYLNCITMEECKAEPWRWKFVQVSPGQESDPEVIAFLKATAPKAEETVVPEVAPTAKRGPAKK